MSRILVVYYSRSGTTKRVATEIATALGADLEEIRGPVRRSGLIGYFHSALEATLRKTTDIDRAVHEPGDYDLVVLGTPVWNASISSPVRTFIRQHLKGLKTVAFFCTCGGRGGERVLRQMTSESGKDPAASLVLRERQVQGGRATPAIRTFVDQVRQKLPAEQTPAPPTEHAAVA